MSSRATGVDGVATIRDVGKCYQIYDRPADRLKQALWRGRRRFYRPFWALRNVSFDVARGQAIGIIGRNGSGKSTLLQVVAGTLEPTNGFVRVDGRVAALLELGSGFNTDFTGRENVFLNGAILGLSEREVRARFDEIADFADIGDFLDQPVKTYSTGMVVRLAFAVQVLLRPNLLIVDEALAVGDAAFQIKCMTRMRRLLDDGVSVLLVTHDVETVRAFCDRAIWLEQGRVAAAGSPSEVTSQYVQFLFGDQQTEPAAQRGGASDDGKAGADVPPTVACRRLTAFSELDGLERWGSGPLRLERFSLDNGVPGGPLAFEHGDRLHIELEVRAGAEVDGQSVGVGFSLRNTKGLDIITYTTWDAGLRLPPLRANQSVRLGFDFENILAAGEYALVVNVEEVRAEVDRHYYDFIENAALLRVTSSRRVFSAVLPHVEQTVFEVR